MINKAQWLYHTLHPLTAVYKIRSLNKIILQSVIMKKIRSNLYVIVSLFLALGIFLYTLSFFLDAVFYFRLYFQVYYQIILFIIPIIPIAFGIIGLSAPARKLAIAGIVISICDIMLKLFFFYIIPIMLIMRGGIG